MWMSPTLHVIICTYKTNCGLILARSSVDQQPGHWLKSNVQYNGYIYIHILHGIYGLQQTGVLANKLLKERIKEHDFFEVPHPPTSPIYTQNKAHVVHPGC